MLITDILYFYPSKAFSAAIVIIQFLDVNTVFVIVIVYANSLCGH